MKLSNVKFNYSNSGYCLTETELLITWEFSGISGTFQEAFTVEIYDENEHLCLSSQKNISSKQEYLFKEVSQLKAATKYFVKVKIKNNQGEKLVTEGKPYFITGIKKTSWQGSWLTGDHLQPDGHEFQEVIFRKEFFIEEAHQKSLRLFITALGIYECYLNGVRLSEELLRPGWTSYHEQLQYQVYDSPLLQKGKNILSVRVANGWYKGILTWKNQKNLYGSEKAFILQGYLLENHQTMGQLVSDTTWSCSQGPVLYSDFYNGERYDGNHRNAGWLERDFSEDKSWSKPKILNTQMTTKLKAQIGESVKVTEIITPKKITKLSSDRYLIDLGQNMVGRLRVNTSKLGINQSVTLRHGEVLKSDGSGIYFGNLREAKQEVTYLAGKQPLASYAATHSFQGFQYVEIKASYPIDWSIADFQGEVMHTDLQRTGYFSCSDDSVNQLYQNIIWGQRGNFLEVPTDCPQRDERLGWTGDAQVFIGTSLFNYEGAAFFTKWLRDLKADQFSDGRVPAVIPDVVSQVDPGLDSSAGWADAITICPWILYKYYGNQGILVEMYEPMKKWLTFNLINSEVPFAGNKGFQFGDWLALDAGEDELEGRTSKAFLATVFFAYSTSIVVKIAEILGFQSDSLYWQEVLTNITAYLRETYLNDGELTITTQTAHALILKFKLFSSGERKVIAADLNELVKANDYHLNTGFLGTPYLCQTLTDYGYFETAEKLFLQHGYPSWLYSVDQGATTIWEHWNSLKEDGSFWSDEMNSFNHYAYGSIGEWMYSELVGIQQEATSVGFKKIIIKPRISQSLLSSVTGSYESVHGLIQSQWQRDKTTVYLKATIPFNTQGKIYLLDADPETVYCNNQKVTSLLRDEHGYYDQKTAGTYEYRFRLERGLP